MIVRPDELANLCAIYSSTRSWILSEARLLLMLTNTVALDAEDSPHRVIASAVGLGLLSKQGSQYRLTKKGKALGKKQGRVRRGLDLRATEYLICRIYLAPDTCPPDCASFLTRFSPDPEAKTFRYQRQHPEDPATLRWLKVLARVGFVHVSETHAWIAPAYLPVMNEALRALRGAPPIDRSPSGELRRKVGEIAEECAVDYERRRLCANGHNDLSKLVKRISLVDETAGYDISSFRGTGTRPEEPILVEVKGTELAGVQFIWSANERRVATIERSHYWLYCFTQVDIHRRTAAGPFRINDPIRRVCLPGYQVQPLSISVKKL